jgi:AraC-like DNA-binding protein
MWVHAIGPSDGTYVQPVLPDGRIDIVSHGNDVTLAGPATRAVTVHVAPGTSTVGLRFRPGAAPSLVGVSAAELRDSAISLDDVWGRTGADIAARCVDSEGCVARLNVLADALQRRLVEASPIDPVGVGIASLLDEHPGRSLPDLAEHVGLSERQLRRRTEQAVGYSPRTLARVLRFRRFLTAARASGPGRHLARLASEAGYADQAHLTRESRQLTGLPPASLLDWEAQRLGT